MVMNGHSYPGPRPTVEGNSADSRYPAEIERMVAALTSGGHVRFPSWGNQTEWQGTWQRIVEEYQGGMTPRPSSGTVAGAASADVFYGTSGPTNGNMYPQARTAGLGVAVVALSVILPLLPAAVRVAATRLGPIGARLAVKNLPSWIKWILVGLGVQELLIDTGPGDVGLIPAPAEIDIGGIAGSILPDFAWPGIKGVLREGTEVQVGRETYIVASYWEANNVIFYRFRNGMLGVQNKHGVWKVWRPRKPIVLFTTGATDLKTLIKANKAVGHQAKQLATVLRNHGYAVAKK